MTLGSHLVASPAPLTPDTLNRIRSEAMKRSAPQIADDLGWELDRLTRVARTHKIELINANAAVEPEMLRPEIEHIAYRSCEQQPQPQHVERHADMSLDDIMATFVGQNLAVMKVLKRALDNQFMTRFEIAARIGGRYDPEKVAATCQRLNGRLAHTRFHIESERSRGYRLKTVKAAP